MITREKVAASTAALALVVGLSACGGGSEAPGAGVNTDDPAFQSQLQSKYAAIDSRNAEISKSTEAAKSSMSASYASESKSAQSQVSKDTKEELWKLDHKFAKYAPMGVRIINNSPHADCNDFLQSKKNWLPGGWSFTCVSAIPSDELKKMTGLEGVNASRVIGLTDASNRTVYIKDAGNAHETSGTIIHELAHTYAEDYIPTTKQLKIAKDNGEITFEGHNYSTSPNEQWARGYAYCFNGTRDSPDFKVMSCSQVKSILNDIKKNSGVDLTYSNSTSPTAALHDRKDAPKFSG